jgi:hypothetical protein
MPLKMPHVMKTPMQITVKMRLRQRDGGITAGRLSFSCRETQKMKVGIRAREVRRRVSVAGEVMLVVLDVMELVSMLVSRLVMRW